MHACSYSAEVHQKLSVVLEVCGFKDSRKLRSPEEKEEQCKMKHCHSFSILCSSVTNICADSFKRNNITIWVRSCVKSFNAQMGDLNHFMVEWD